MGVVHLSRKYLIASPLHPTYQVSNSPSSNSESVTSDLPGLELTILQQQVRYIRLTGSQTHCPPTASPLHRTYRVSNSPSPNSESVTSDLPGLELTILQQRVRYIGLTGSRTHHPPTASPLHRTYRVSNSPSSNSESVTLDLPGLELTIPQQIVRYIGLTGPRTHHLQQRVRYIGLTGSRTHHPPTASPLHRTYRVSNSPSSNSESVTSDLPGLELTILQQRVRYIGLTGSRTHHPPTASPLHQTYRVSNSPSSNSESVTSDLPGLELTILQQRRVRYIGLTGSRTHHPPTASPLHWTYRVSNSPSSNSESFTLDLLGLELTIFQQRVRYIGLTGSRTHHPPTASPLHRTYLVSNSPSSNSESVTSDLPGLELTILQQRVRYIGLTWSRTHHPPTVSPLHQTYLVSNSPSSNSESVTSDLPGLELTIFQQRVCYIRLTRSRTHHPPTVSPLHGTYRFSNSPSSNSESVTSDLPGLELTILQQRVCYIGLTGSRTHHPPTASPLHQTYRVSNSPSSDNNQVHTM
ncbi:uncharacterized protein DKFZp434B061-like [Ptychodera flava]|uniref:uncharacterized protein DKFZp434B061-like n=1 Tax=Ptychodera flava TaxID=63121 RepID=UPI00396A1D4F